MGKGLDMNFFYGFADELVKVATDEPMGEYEGPVAAGGTAGAILGALTSKKGSRLQDAIITGLMGAGLGAGQEYWRRREAEKTASRTFSVGDKKDIRDALGAIAGISGVSGAGWGFITEPGGLKKRLKAGGKWGLASAIGAPLAAAIMNRKTIRDVLKDKG
jgi:hypothetical protein